MKTVKYKVYNEMTRNFQEYAGLFHEWGLEDGQAGSVTVGIVQCAYTGKIFTVAPERIQFV